MIGSCSRTGQYVRGDCACGARDELVYDTGESLVCASCYRRWAKAHPQKQACDKCGSTGNVWRDPIPRKNEYLCVRCHDPEALFVNRWANKVRESTPLGLRERVTCELAGYGTACKGEVRWVNALGYSVCNFHRGRKSANPANN